MQARPRGLIAPLLLLAVETACQEDNDTASEDSCVGDDRADAFAVGLEKAGAAGLVIAHLVDAEPARPQAGRNRWALSFRDASGESLRFADVTAAVRSPDHAHGTTHDTRGFSAEGGPFVFDPLGLPTAGLWDVDIDVFVDRDVPEPLEDTITFTVCVE